VAGPEVDVGRVQQAQHRPALSHLGRAPGSRGARVGFPGPVVSFRHATGARPERLRSTSAGSRGTRLLAPSRVPPSTTDLPGRPPGASAPTEEQQP
jgi:hypothetical protein